MSTSLYAVFFIGGALLYGIVGVVLTRRVVRRHVAEGHNDVLVPIFLTAGVIYAVLLGFTVVAEWESYDAAKTNTAEEAALLVPMYRQSRVMVEDKGDSMRHLLRGYAEHVVEGWTAFRDGKRNTTAGTDANEIIKVFATMAPATKARELVAQQFLETFSQMVFKRNKRYAHAAEAMSPLMWMGIIIGGLVTIGFTFIIYMERCWPHVVAVGVLSVLIGLLLFVAALFSRPFHGPLAISPEPFEQVLAVFDQVDKGQ